MAYSYEQPEKTDTEPSRISSESFAEAKALHDRIADESALTTVLSAVPTPLLILNETRQICFANDAALSLFSTPSQEKALGLPIQDILGESRAFESQGTSKNGDSIPFQAVDAAIQGESVTDDTILVVRSPPVEEQGYTLRGVPLPIDNRKLALIILEPAS